MQKLNQIISGEIVHNKHWQQLRKNLLDVMADPDDELSVNTFLAFNFSLSTLMHSLLKDVPKLILKNYFKNYLQTIFLLTIHLKKKIQNGSFTFLIFQDLSLKFVAKSFTHTSHYTSQVFILLSKFLFFNLTDLSFNLMV